MFSPDNTALTDFLFTTYTGYFVLVLPVALLCGIFFTFGKYVYDRRTSNAHRLSTFLFATYASAVICLVLLLWQISAVWNFFLCREWTVPIKHIIYENEIFHLTVDFFKNFNSERLFNIILYLPFGILHPLACKKPNWFKTVGTGLLFTLVLELIQPAIGRYFDLNDIVLNVIGVAVSATVFFILRRIFRKK